MIKKILILGLCVLATASCDKLPGATNSSKTDPARNREPTPTSACAALVTKRDSYRANLDVATALAVHKQLKRLNSDNGSSSGDIIGFTDGFGFASNSSNAHAILEELEASSDLNYSNESNLSIITSSLNPDVAKQFVECVKGEKAPPLVAVLEEYSNESALIRLWWTPGNVNVPTASGQYTIHVSGGAADQTVPLDPQSPGSNTESITVKLEPGQEATINFSVKIAGQNQSYKSSVRYSYKPKTELKVVKFPRNSEESEANKYAKAILHWGSQGSQAQSPTYDVALAVTDTGYQFLLQNPELAKNFPYNLKASQFAAGNIKVVGADPYGAQLQFNVSRGENANFQDRVDAIVNWQEIFSFMLIDGCTSTFLPQEVKDKLPNAKVCPATLQRYGLTQ